MFTGLVEKISKVIDFKLTSQGARICFEFEKEVKLGDSISVNGVCLTVVSIDKNIVSADVMKQTLSTTNLINLKKGDLVNLERAMTLNKRLDGHLVTGHIDTICTVSSIKEDGFSKKIEIQSDTSLIVEKGSVAINGVSLTIAEVREKSFVVSLIPATQKDTNLGLLKSGDKVNIEYDVIAKYLYKFTKEKQKFKITEEFLKNNGF